VRIGGGGWGEKKRCHVPSPIVLCDGEGRCAKNATVLLNGMERTFHVVVTHGFRR
jgi:hypothetical protein